MTLTGSTKIYDIVARDLPRFMTLIIIVMLAFGLWMFTLGLYNPWYSMVPDIRDGLGIFLSILLVGPICWRIGIGQPDDSH